MLTLADVLEALTGSRPEIAPLVISEAAVDSRQVIPGALFVALPGERVDGHNYLGNAFQRGAQLALVQQDVSDRFAQMDVRAGLPADLTVPAAPFCLRVDDSLKAMQQIARFWRRKVDVRVIGITGSVGKSTTKELVSQVLCTRYRTLRNPGNLNNEIGLPLTLLRLSPGYERAVLEMGFYVSGEIAFLCDLALPQVGVVTNVGTVHAERAGSQEAIARGKSELVQALPADGVAILNYDDPWVRNMAGVAKSGVFFYGMDSHADLWADNVEGLGLEGIRFRLHFRNEIIHMRAPLIGQHSVHTALRAAAVGLVEGLTWSDIVHGLQMGQTQLRLVAVHTQEGALLLDDTYNASPESTLAALNLLSELDGRKYAVLGDMYELGPYEKQGHEKVGIRAAEVAQRLLAVGELGKMIADAALNAGMPASAVSWVATVQEAIDHLRGNLREGDVVLVKGSHGLHMEKIVAALEVNDD
ncbi:MAG: UDP-N-acetylmuramoyl-tripeptide--D-alanyl-D-alanine ligase [Anaerolineaceae bacterium]